MLTQAFSPYLLALALGLGAWSTASVFDVYRTPVRIASVIMVIVIGCAVLIANMPGDIPYGLDVPERFVHNLGLLILLTGAIGITAAMWFVGIVIGSNMPGLIMRPKRTNGSVK